MYSKLLMVIVFTTMSVRAAVVPKPELRGILTDEDFTKLEELVPRIAAVWKLYDTNKLVPLGEEVRSITSKLSIDPEGWTDAEYDAKVVAFRHVADILKKIPERAISGFRIGDKFADAVGVYVASSTDTATFAKRWNKQSKLADIQLGFSSLDGARRKETIDFMNGNTTLFPDVPARIKFIDWLASVNIRTKGLNELRAEMADTPPDDPKAKPKQKRQRP